MIAIVVSRADEASEHIGERLLELGEWKRRVDDSRPDADGGGACYRTDGFELRTFDDLHLNVEDAAAAFDDPDALVFASRHSGETGPLLTAHFTGNFGPAEFGGEAGALAEACPNAHARCVESFAEHAPEGYGVGIECTHHGPSRVGVPSMFVELGSDEAEWRDPAGARAVARAILDLRGTTPHRDRTVVGFGGGHYAPRFTRIVRETDWAVGHIAADWCVDAMGSPEANRDVVRRTFERSGTEYAVVDGDYPELERTIEDLGYRVVSETWVREVDDRPLPLVERVESALDSIDDGLRFGDRDEPAPGEFDVVSLPDELLAEAQAIDPDATRAAVASATVAFETVENGTRAQGRAAVPTGTDTADLADALTAILSEKYDRVARNGDALVATETVFDPELAAKLGVPEGPAFGALADGESVTVDGEPIPPEVVHTERTHRFDL
ncbi:D-aminoacyl-tRNA deacylase [Halostella sp. PRR32]|uniref:D-aminoacyl-tRNA deacylase n=1 Tax=Halostella sp. PRR32 TaxID=3098147 RepID=UPI002B1E38AE|nr:D-aminoacyl-tRNA deacylase [Halostella sp. PRR32]